MIPRVLTIAGSDSGGGAGIQADLKTFAALEVFGLSAITAITAQSTVEVRAIHRVPAELVRAQIDTVCDDFAPRFAKTGMLHDAELIGVVARAIEERGLSVVVDPVMIAESGASLLEPAALPAILRELLPLASILTPNLPEAEALLGRRIPALADRREAAKALVALGARAVVVKGGHAEGPPIDVYAGPEGVVELGGERIATTSTHGTGCTFSAAIAAYLARGAPPLAAVQAAHGYLRAALLAAPRDPALGRGRGPVHHLHPWYLLPR